MGLSVEREVRARLGPPRLGGVLGRAARPSAISPLKASVRNAWTYMGSPSRWGEREGERVGRRKVLRHCGMGWRGSIPVALQGFLRRVEAAVSLRQVPQRADDGRS